MGRQRFNIINKAEKVTIYVMGATDKCPKKLRCDIVPELRKNAFRILEDIIRANSFSIDKEDASSFSRNERKRYQEDCLSTIRVLESFADIANAMTYITNHQFDYMTQLTQELFDMVKNWMASDIKRCAIG